MNPMKLCETWDENCCKVSDVEVKKAGDYFVVTGKVTANSDLECVLPQLRLNVNLLDKHGRKIRTGVLGPVHRGMSSSGDILHLTDRALSPGELMFFKLEGLWNEHIESCSVDVKPYDGCKKGDK